MHTAVVIIVTKFIKLTKTFKNMWIPIILTSSNVTCKQRSLHMIWNSLTIGFVCTQLLPPTQMIVNFVVSSTKQIKTWKPTWSTNTTSSYVTCVKWNSVAFKNLGNTLMTICADVVTRDLKTLKTVFPQTKNILV